VNRSFAHHQGAYRPI